MSYTPTTWVTGDTITATKLNKMEQGIADAGGGVSGLCTVTNGTMDKSFNDLSSLVSQGVIPFIHDSEGYIERLIWLDDSDGYCATFGYATDDAYFMYPYIGSTADAQMVLD